MKKIVGIIAALALAGAVFADAPVASITDITFDGNASLEYIVNLDGANGEGEVTTGMKNAESANFKLKFITGGTKASTGDGVWGEIEIKTTDATAAGDGAVAINKATVEKAVIHILEDDFFLDMNIRRPTLALGKDGIKLATSSAGSVPDANAAKITFDTVTDVSPAGFTLNFGLKDVVEFGLQFADNGQKKSSEKEFAFVFDTALKAVSDLTLKASVGYGTKANKVAFTADAAYKVGLGDMYILPAVGFAFTENKDKYLHAGLLFGWGGQDIEAKFASFSKGVTNVPDKCADGVSVYASIPLKDSPAIGFLFSAFDSKFLGDFGLKVGAQLAVADLANFGKNDDAFDAAVAFSKAFGDWNVDANAGIKFIIDGSKFGALYGFGVSNSALIDNTKLYLNYKGEHAAAINSADLKGTITLGCEISI